MEALAKTLPGITFNETALLVNTTEPFARTEFSLWTQLKGLQAAVSHFSVVVCGYSTPKLKNEGDTFEIKFDGIIGRSTDEKVLELR